MVEISIENVQRIIIILMLATFFGAIGTFFISVSDTNNVVNYEFGFNYQNWDRVNISEAILGIITTASAIVAIGFSINHITYSKVYETYSSRSFRFFFEEQKLFSAFIALILIIIFSTIGLLIIDGLLKPLQFMFLTILVIGFIYSLGLFYVTFHRTFRLLNKFDIISDVENMTIRKMENLGNEN